MMNSYSVLLVPLVFLTLMSSPIAQAETADLAAPAEQPGEVRVIVELYVEFNDETAADTNTSEAATREDRRRAISQAQEAILSRLSAHHIHNITAYTSIPYLAMTVDQATLRALAEDPTVASIAHDFDLAPLMMESVPLLGASSAWGKGFSGAGWSVAILDSGVESSHPFLQGKVVAEACFSTGGRADTISLCPNGESEQTGAGAGVPCSLNQCYHGTHIAGIAAGKGEKFSGIARDATIISVQVFRARTGGSSDASSISASLSDILLGLEYVYELSDSHQIAAVNLSLGSRPMTNTERCDSMSRAMYDIVENLRSAGVATVAAAGNNGASNGIHFPACLSNVISVGSTSSSFGTAPGETISSFSNSAPFLDLLAPGAGIVSSVPGGGFSSHQGTSMATPHVVGAWAVLHSAAPDASVGDLRDLLKATGAPLTDSRNNVTVPRIQLDAALTALQTPTTEILPAPTNLKAERDETGHTRLTWKDNSISETRFTIERWQQNVSKEWSQIATVEPDVITYTDTEVQRCAPGYTYRLAAYTADNTYLYSTIASPRSTGCVVVSEKSSQIFLPLIRR